MSIKLIYETERVTKLKEQLKEMNREELDFVEHLIDRERERRKKEVFDEWIDHLQMYTDKDKH